MKTLRLTRAKLWLLSASVVIFVFLFGSYRVADAAPVDPTPLKLTQPDGTQFTAQPYGDEWTHGYEYNDYSIVRSEVDSYWYYAKSVEGDRFTASAERVAIDQPPFYIQQHLRVPNRGMPVPAVLVAKQLADWAGTSGSQPVLIILADFAPSTSMGTTATQWHTAFFDDSAEAKSVKRFYEEASRDAFTLEPATESNGIANDGIIEVTLDYAHPNPGANTNIDNRQIVRDALVAADPFVDFAQYNDNGNYWIDVQELHIIVIPRGFETAFGGSEGACTPGVWGHRWSLFATMPAPILDGLKISDYYGEGGYMQFGEWQALAADGCDGSAGNMATIGIMAHELGHDIGWPDMYDTDGTSAGIGYWSVMAAGSWGNAQDEPPGTTPTLPDAFSRMYQGWVTPTLVTDDMTAVEIDNSAETDDIYQLLPNTNGIDWVYGQQSGSGQYFLIENRQPVGFDAGLFRIDPQAGGCLIWHIDETRTSGNSNNNNELWKHVDVEAADGNTDMDDNINRGDTGDTWPGSSGATSFNTLSTPSTNYYNETLSGVAVENISAAGATGCRVDFNLEQPDLTLSTSDGTTESAPNESLNYTLTYTNTGSWAADSLVLTEVIPEHTEFDAANSSAGWQCAPGKLAGGICELTIDLSDSSKTSSGSAIFAIVVDSDATPGTLISNTATVSGDGTNGAVDVDLSNNTDTDADTTILAQLAIHLRQMAAEQGAPTIYLAILCFLFISCLSIIRITPPSKKHK